MGYRPGRAPHAALDFPESGGMLTPGVTTTFLQARALPAPRIGLRREAANSVDLGASCSGAWCADDEGLGVGFGMLWRGSGVIRAAATGARLLNSNRCLGQRVWVWKQSLLPLTLERSVRTRARACLPACLLAFVLPSPAGGPHTFPFALIMAPFSLPFQRFVPPPPYPTPIANKKRIHLAAQERATGTEATVCTPCLVNNRDILDASESQRPQDPSRPSDRSFRPIPPADFMGGSRSRRTRPGQDPHTLFRSRPRTPGHEAKETDPGPKAPGRSSMGTEVGPGVCGARLCVCAERRWG